MLKDRLDEVERLRKELNDERLMAKGLIGKLHGDRESLEAKLAKAIEALREIEDCLGSDPDGPHRDCVEHARAVLKELEK